MHLISAAAGGVNFQGFLTVSTNKIDTIHTKIMLQQSELSAQYRCLSRHSL